MSKEYTWELSMNGQQHVVECVQINNRYVLYADSDYLTTVYRKWKQNKNGGLDEPINIYDQQCRFIVWDEQPDLMVDGWLVARNKEYLSEKKRRIKQNMTAGSMMIILGTLIFAITVLLILLGMAKVSDANRWCAAVMCGILLVVKGVRLRIRWKEMK